MEQLGFATLQFTLCYEFDHAKYVLHFFNVILCNVPSGATKSCLRVSLCLKNLINHYFSTYIFIVL